MLNRLLIFVCFENKYFGSVNLFRERWFELIFLMIINNQLNIFCEVCDCFPRKLSFENKGKNIYKVLCDFKIFLNKFNVKFLNKKKC